MGKIKLEHMTMPQQKRKSREKMRKLYKTEFKNM